MTEERDNKQFSDSQWIRIDAVMIIVFVSFSIGKISENLIGIIFCGLVIGIFLYITFIKKYDYKDIFMTFKELKNTNYKKEEK
jgi:hypothetical protein